MVSGILAEVTRLADIATLAYPIYFIHLVFVFSLFVYLPYSKLAHLFYRSAALCFNKYSGREVQQAAQQEVQLGAGPEASSEAETSQTGTEASEAETEQGETEQESKQE